MYGFPPQNELSNLISKNLIQICCTANQINLHFDSDISISIEADQFQVIKNKEIIEIGIPINNLTVFELLEHTVTQIETKNSNSTLELHFNDNYKIILTDDKDYESYHISINKKEIII